MVKGNKILVYGCSGFTAKLFLKRVGKSRQKDLILAGRTAARVQGVADELGFAEILVFSLEEASQKSELDSVRLIINFAGPFAKTQSPLIQACIKHQCHYIDIAGEVDEMTRAYEFHDQAKKVGVQIMPGCGFGVVPTDLVAKAACEKLYRLSGNPKPSKLEIAYVVEGGASRGTLSTVLPLVEKEGYRLEAGKLVKAMPAESTLDFKVESKKFHGIYDPKRADIFTAGLSTGCPNVATYAVLPKIVVWMMQGWLLWLRNFLVNYALPYMPEGPSEKEMDRGWSCCSATAYGGEQQATVSLRGPEAYRFTADCLREIIVRLVDKNEYVGGFSTPSSYGVSILDHINGVEWFDQ